MIKDTYILVSIINETNLQQIKWHIRSTLNDTVQPSTTHQREKQTPDLYTKQETKKTRHLQQTRQPLNCRLLTFFFAVFKFYSSTYNVDSIYYVLFWSGGICTIWNKQVSFMEYLYFMYLFLFFIFLTIIVSRSQ